MILSRTSLGVIWVALLLVPVAVGIALVSDARRDVFFENGVRYTHQTVANQDMEEGLTRLMDVVPVVRTGETPVPRIFLANLPETLADMRVRARKQAFVATLLPLVLRANEIILEDRAKLKSLKNKTENGQSLNRIERSWVQTMVERYRVRQELSTNEKLARLLIKVDIIPPSLALAQAAIESGWGTSRFAREGNALYGQWVWNDAKGIIPEGREEGQGHSIRAFDYLIDSVLGYMQNLNRHPGYAGLRAKRADLRQSGMLNGRSLTDTLVNYSERREAYVNELDIIIRANQFTEFDGVTLEPLWWAGLAREDTPG